MTGEEMKGAASAGESLLFSVAGALFFLYKHSPICYNAPRYVFRDAGREHSDARFVTGE